MTKAQLVALIVTELGVQTDDELRRAIVAAQRLRRRRQAEKALQKAHDDARIAGEDFAARIRAAEEALASEPPIEDE